MKHKNTSKAVIYDRGLNHVLMLEKRFPDGSLHFTLPGGVTDPGETLTAALERECLEEINCVPEVVRLLYVCEFDKPAADGQGWSRRIEFGFLCTIPEGYSPQMGPVPDTNQTDVCWIALESLESLSLIPAGIGRVIAQRADVMTGYLGFCPYIQED